jgi:hypothetical protein
MPGSLFSAKTGLMSHEPIDYAPETKNLHIEELHDGTFTCRDHTGLKGSYKNLASLIKGIKEIFSSEESNGDAEE